MNYNKSAILLFLFLILTITNHANAQTKNKQYQGAAWFRYNTNIQLPQKIVLKAELEERAFIAKKLKQHQIYVRLTVDKQLPKNWNIGVGFSG